MTAATSAPASTAAGGAGLPDTSVVHGETPLRYQWKECGEPPKTVEIERFNALDGDLKPAINLGLASVWPALVQDNSEEKEHKVVCKYGPGGRVGVCTVNGGLWEVNPKIDGANFLRLLDIALTGNSKPAIKLDGTADLDSRPEDSFVLLLLHALQSAYNRLFSGCGGLRPLIVERSETLRARVRGRVVVGEYLRNVAQLRIAHIPCRFQRIHLDHALNRRLHRGLRIARQLLGLSSWLSSGFSSLSASVTALQSRFTELEARFGGIPATLLPGDRRVPVAPSLKTYRDTGALTLADLLIDWCVLSDKPGANQTIGIAIDMARIFEAAVTAACRGLEGVTKFEPQKHWSVSALGAQGHKAPTPDVYVEYEDLVLVVDAKWKEAVTTSVGSSNTTEDGIELIQLDGFKVSPSDFYQIMAYQRLAATSTGKRAIGVLVYPSEKEATVAPWSLDGNKPLEIYTAPWSMEVPDAEPLRKALNKIVAEARAATPPLTGAAGDDRHERVGAGA